MWSARALLVASLLAPAPAQYNPDGMLESQRAKCDGDGFTGERKYTYAKNNYKVCCGKGRYQSRRQICKKAAPVVSDEERTPAWPKMRSPVSDECTACARLVDNFDMGLLPALHKRQKQIEKHHSRSHYAKLATIGDLEGIVEFEVERICNWPRTHHAVRRSCVKLVEERSEEIVLAISGWARDGSYSINLGGELSTELRPALCVTELGVCSEEDVQTLVTADSTENAQLGEAKDTGYVEDKPMESEAPSLATEGVLLRVTSQDFHKRIVDEGADVDWLIYMYFPGRTAQVMDTHAKLRGKFISLAQFLDAPGSNGTLKVGWMDCVFNQIPHPHGMHVKDDTIAIYPAGKKMSPNYYLNLREGDVEIHELAEFVYEATGLEATQQHVLKRYEELGERGLFHGLDPIPFLDALAIDERQLQPHNLSKIRHELVLTEGFTEKAKTEL